MKNFVITLFTLVLTSLIITNVNAQYWTNTTSSPSYSYIQANTNDYRGVILGGSAPEPITNAMFSVYGDSNQEGIVAYSDVVGITAISTGIALRAEGLNGGIAGEFLGDVEVQGELAAVELTSNKLQVGTLNTSTSAVLFAQNPNGGLAAHFDGDVKVEDGHVAIGDYMNLTGGLDALLQVKTSAPQTFGIRAESEHAIAVTGVSTNAAGVSGGSINRPGVYGASVESNAIEGHSVNGIGVYGISDNGLAGRFDGDLKVNGFAEISTAHGAVTIGAANPWNTHFYTTSPQFYFNEKVRVNGQISATALNFTSDKRLKKDVQSFEYGLDEVLQLNPLTYDYTGKGGTKSGDYNVGLFAQDLQKVAPEFVTEFTHRERNDKGEVNEEGKDYLQIYDTGIKYMLINATKEQQEIIDNQAAKIETLEETLAELKATVEALVDDGQEGINHQSIRLQDNTSSLEQNQPNPFSNSTLIKYKLPKDATNAVITIFDTNGQMIHKESITQPGTGEIQLQANDLTTGTYSYTLTVDGRIISTKKMVVIK